MLCWKWWMQLLFIYVVPKGIWSFPGTWPFFSRLSFFGHDAHFFPVFQGNICAQKNNHKYESSYYLQSVLSMNDVTGNYLWLAPLKPNLFPLYIFSALLRPPMFSGSWSNSTDIVIGQKDPSFVFFLRRPSFMVSILGLVHLVLAPVAWLCLSSIFTVLARAQKWQLWSPRSQFTTP